MASRVKIGWIEELPEDDAAAEEGEPVAEEEGAA